MSRFLKLAVVASVPIAGYLYYQRRNTTKPEHQNATAQQQQKPALITAANLRPLVICGPSGVGKGTLRAMLEKEFPNQFGRCTTHTTRPPRKGEVDGIHYHFTTAEKMKAEIAEGKFIEHALVHGNIYGSSVAGVQKIADQGKICIMEIDVQGAESIHKNTKLNPWFFFISPPTFETLRQRLLHRGTESDDVIKVRLETARKEMDYFEKRKEFFHHTVINNDLDHAYGDLREKVVKCYPQLTDVKKAVQNPTAGNSNPALEGPKKH
eukprot:TRINITY_DN7446_c0_g1_i1.p1 TRINITY_DN7446_c0_g1~~TRINITY_DN7446_c0_g1_i1.p1  ORF type:complete len:266 (-),score=52.48 TRINITY_DN7446_c0_g1_i1:143-940(-)